MTATETATRNLYPEDAGQTTDYPALDGHCRASIAIIGGGFTGLSTALHLAEAGERPILLDSEGPGWGASGRNGGQLNPGLKYDPDILEAMFGQEAGAALVDFAYGVTDFTAGLVKRHGIECDLRQNGTIRAATLPKHAKTVERTAAQCIRRGMPVRILSPDELQNATGTDRYCSAMWDARGGDLNPYKFALGLASAAAQAGARIHGATPVLSLDRVAGDWVLRTPHGTVRAQRVLLATNGYTGALFPGLERSVVPVFSAIAATAPLPDALAARIMATRAVLYEAGLITVYYRVDAHNRLLIGGRGPMRPLDTAAVLGNLTGYAQTLWPDLAGIEWTHGWNGRIAMTKDHLPHIHDLAPGLTACLGYNGRGVALSAALGERLADYLRTDDAGVLPFPTTPVQPFPFQRFWPLGAWFAIQSGRIRDRFGI
ncbi:FAD-binding oxidoreductase [Rhodospirillaceae bacterium KN72]|uniref:FAD-binding oxidoreductase n=1 Tax=Pacificispira spongiicola TaxID=2729598 RepID=A0A7Y0DWX3_9PROT|nr:FAD-binding oxidoreductase [Pacificispira spongiicola]NMM43108.1 FAD-binding oxidoreductase [Pacificispira spongiicola]